MKIMAPDPPIGDQTFMIYMDSENSPYEIAHPAFIQEVTSFWALLLCS